MMHPNVSNSQTAPRSGEVAAIVAAHRYLAAPYLANRERIRDWHADAERHRLLTQHGVVPTAAVLVARCRLVAGAMLVRAGERLIGVSRSRTLPTADIVAASSPSWPVIGS